MSRFANYLREREARAAMQQGTAPKLSFALPPAEDLAVIGKGVRELFKSVVGLDVGESMDALGKEVTGLMEKGNAALVTEVVALRKTVNAMAKILERMEAQGHETQDAVFAMAAQMGVVVEDTPSPGNAKNGSTTTTT